MAGAGLFIALFGLAAAGQKPPVSAAKPPVALSATAPAANSAVTALFESKIRPMLLASCVGCHSKDSPGGGLRLDVAVSPDKAQEILRRVHGEGGKQKMPLGPPLSKEKITALETWVRAGALWGSAKPIGESKFAAVLARGKNHWAFQPLVRPTVPKTNASAWIRSPIDAFVLQKLIAKGLKPNPTASRRELIRRVTYDLTGLPPTPEEAAAFEADTAPNAYERLVDRLLASPHYGERWGRHWLDLVRYAETNSYERDNPKPNVYKYRDYVIRAFNADKPYNRFVQEQIAGDELPDATGDSLTATAYYRLGIWDDEPADVKQAEADDADDLVATTGQAFLGLTFDCARCHDHKFDPIPQKDYYRLVSFFHNINRFKNGGPTDESAYFATEAERKVYDAKVAEIEDKRKTNAAQTAAIEAVYKQNRAALLNPGDISDLKYRYYEGAFAALPDFDALKPTATGTLTPAFLDLKPRKRDENFGFVYEGILNVAKEGEYTFYLDTDDGSRLTVNGKKLTEKPIGGGQGMEMRGIIRLAAGKVPFRVDYFQGGSLFGLNFAWSGPGFARRPLTPLENSSVLGTPTLAAAELPLTVSAEQAGRYVRLTAEKAELDKAAPPTPDKTLCVTEAGPTAPDTFVLLRGNPQTPGDKVEPAFPLCLGGGVPVVAAPSAGAKTARRRLALANWLTAPNNPLTARVIVNRIWQHHFGRGLVRTANDFGLQGSRPTHPELLNWLAKEFMAQGWSFKKLHKLILMSNTYKQSSRSNALGLAKDPQNDSLWRFEMRRLDAEEIRDSVLSVSGSLNPALFGPPIYPEVSKEVLATQSIPGADWETAKMKPEDLNRRSIYIHVKRSLIYPLLASFDLPETDRPNAARFASTQPTQALSLMNGPLLNQQAALLAERIHKEISNSANDKRAFINRLLSLITQRIPTELEIAECLKFTAKLEKRGVKPEQAQTYLSLLALNLDEFLYLD